MVSKKKEFIFLSIFFTAFIFSETPNLEDTSAVAAASLSYFLTPHKHAESIEILGIRFYVPAVGAMPKKIDAEGVEHEAYARLLFRTVIYDLKDDFDIQELKRNPDLVRFRMNAKRAVRKGAMSRDENNPLQLRKVDDQTYCRYKFDKKEDKECIECISYLTKEQLDDFWEKVSEVQLAQGLFRAK